MQASYSYLVFVNSKQAPRLIKSIRTHANMQTDDLATCIMDTDAVRVGSAKFEVEPTF